MAVEFVGIELQLRGAEGVKQDLQNIDRILNSLGGKKKLQTGLDQLRRDAVTSKGEIQRLEKELERLNGIKAKYGDNASAFVDRDIEKATEALKEQKQQYKDIMQAQREVQTSARSMGDTMKQTFDKISSSVTHIGSKMQSLGNAMVRLTSPFERLTTGLLMGAGYKVLNKFTEGLSSGFSRYDTMKKYPKLMAEYATASYTAEQSVQDLDTSVQGLPIALDDAVSLAQRYTLSLGDMYRGTNLAIATNNAFLASMATETQRYQGMMQMQDLLNGKDLNAREWMSLGASMGKAINEIGKEFGYTEKNMGEFRQELYAGEIATEDFLKALEKVGTGEGSLVALARESMDTWEAFFSRIGTAASRMVYGTLKSLDAISQSMTGMDVNQLIDKKVIPAIDGMTASVKSWIDTHPEEIKDFFTDLSKIDITGLITGLARGMADIVKFWSNLATLFKDKGLEGFGRMIMWTNLLGKGLLVLGGGLKGLAHPIALLGTAIKTAIGGSGKGGLFGLFGKLFGKSEAADATGSVLKTVSHLDALKTIGVGFAKTLSVLGTALATAGTVAGVTFAAKYTIQNMVDIVNMLKEVSPVDLKAVAGNIAVFTTVFSGLAAVVGSFAGLGGLAGAGIFAGITTIVSLAATIDTWLIKKAVENYKSIADGLNEAIDSFSKLEGRTIPQNAISNAFSALRQVHEKYDEEGINQINRKKSKRMKEVVENLVDVVDSLGNMAISLNELDGVSSVADGVSEKVGKIFTEIGQIYDVISSDFSTKAHVSHSKNVGKVLKNTNEMFKTLLGENGIIAQINSIGSEVNKITVSGASSGVSAVTSAKQGLETLFNKLGELYIVISDFESKGGTTTRTGNAKKTVENIQGMFDLFIGEGGIISQISNIGNEINKVTVAGASSGVSAITSAKQGLTTLFGALGDIYESIVDPEKGLGMYQTVTKGSSGTANEILGNVKEMFNSIIGEDGIVAQLSEMGEPLGLLVDNTYGGEAPMEKVKEKLGTFFQGLADIHQSLIDAEIGDMTTFSSTMQSLKEGIGYIGEAMTAINEMQTTIAEIKPGEGEGSFAVLDSIKNLVNNLKSAFNSEEILALKTQIDLFKASVDSLKASLESIGSIGGEGDGGINVNITIIPIITGDTETIEKLKKAHDDIKKQRDAINKLSMDINLSFPISVDLPGLDAAVAEIYNAADRLRTARAALRSAGSGIIGGGGGHLVAATGGFITGHNKVLYRAKGGNALFPGKPKGTDTVPVWTTPGEYIHNRRAVDFFGINFMQKINRLDVAGALNELMARAGHMANVGRQTIVHNTYNNNQKVIQNINTNSPDFAYRASSRYVGAF